MKKLTSLSIACLYQVAQASPSWLDQACSDCPQKMRENTGVYILEEGEDSLLARAWLTRHTTTQIDIQYFIWSTDNIGILASAELLDAANRGVKIRVLVDDLLIDAENKTLLALDAHQNVDIRIYNPMHSVGVSGFKRAIGLLTRFRDSNQRMHDKTAIFDGIAGITGGRNMADEYYDFDHKYNFRDRDVLLLGPAVSDMTENFDEFWQSELAVPVGRLLASGKQYLTPEEVTAHHQMLKAYAANPKNFAPEVRSALTQISEQLPLLIQQLEWDKVTFISDIPGKNNNNFALDGSGEATDQLLHVVRNAKKSILIQSPYLVLPKEGIKLFEALIKRGVSIQISTNSLASTDNLMAFSGYYKQRKKLLDIGVEIFEFKPNAAIRQQLIARQGDNDSIFAIHAKSLVVDNNILFIGTFNLDPRSANLNTEVGVLMNNKNLSEKLAASIKADMRPENSWKITSEFNPDRQEKLGKRFKMWMYRLLPMDAVL